MIAAIDLGTTYTKTNTGLIFPSGISEQICMQSNVMTLGKKQYVMELSNYRAEFDININKGLNKNTRLNFIYALTKTANYEDTHYNSVYTSLPCSQWKSEDTVSQFKDYLSIDEPIQVDIDGYTKTISVGEIYVLPEDAPAYYCSEINNVRFNGRKVLLIGIGSLTTNSILFENDSLVDLHTDEIGILKIYKDCAEKITTITGYDIKYTDMFGILQYGLYISGKPINIESIIEPIIMEYCNTIYKNLKLKWSIDTIRYVPLIGAGGITLEKYLKRYIPQIELQENPQLLSVIGMGEMVVTKL